MAGRRYRAGIGALIVGSLVFSSTGAIAAAAPPVTQPDPWALLSAMSGGAAAASVCGAAAAAAAAAVQPAAGCVLPQVDVAAVPAQGAPPAPIPVPPVEPASSGFGISPLLLGLIAVAAGAALYFLVLHKKHHHANSPA
jgi:hypothetical protein